MPRADRLWLLVLGGLACTASARPLAAQREAAEAQRIEPRPLGAPLATSAPGTVVSVSAMRALASGSFFVNDPQRRRLVLLDTMLRVKAIAADTTADTRRIYGYQATGLFGGRGDSTYFLDGSAMSIVVFDADARVARIMAPPRPRDFGQLMGGAAGVVGLDAAGRLVYRGTGIDLGEQRRRGRMHEQARPDSVPLVRFDFATRRLDTITTLSIYTPAIQSTVTSTGFWLQPILHPAPVVDEWAVLPSGVVAVLRGSDYHVDLYDGGQVRHAPPIPHAWRRLSDADREALIDSSRAVRARLLALGFAPNIAPIPGTEPVSRNSIVVSVGPPGPGNDPAEPEVTYVPASDIPDYLPAFGAGAMRADFAGRLWIRTIPTRPARGTPYDVLDGSGRLVDRVLLPRDATVAGFGPHDTVILGVREGSQLRLERYRYREP